MCVLAFPLIKDKLLNDRAGNAMSASASLQADLVRTYLRHEQKQPTIGESPSESPLPIVFFDRKSAMICPLDSVGECDATELLYVGEDSGLVDAADATVPLAVQKHLETLMLTRYLNSDPKLPGVTFIAKEENSPLVHAPEFSRCSPSLPINIHIIRMSRAAVDSKEKVALAFVQRRYCDGSMSLLIAHFTKEEDSWKIKQVLRHGGGP